MYHMRVLLIPLLILITFCCKETESIVCGNFCDDVQCEVIDECPPGQTLKPVGYCLCCLKCVPILQLNEKCAGFTFLMGVPPNPNKCGEGLSCINGVCKPSISMITRF
ncbi:hypothetical protein RN001_011632 [Aquatica leii]|uniref:Uncharacterized protein n=1 Tax=Aquatica leii TaxID=1421715 RepID=A0AAN7Q0X3_9COLE|nr:hypothetical protein RN001_011632 [Aquatica leii]